MKSGIGSHVVQIGELKVGALVGVNALGDVYDLKTGKRTAFVQPSRICMRAMRP